MRRIHSIAILTVFAASGAGAQSQSAPTLRIVTETPMMGKDHKGEIEILSYSWGVSRAPAGQTGGEHEAEYDLVAGNAAGGPRQTATTDGTRAAADGDPDKPIVAGTVPNAKFGAVSGVRRDDGLAPVQSGQATGKRQHKPLTITKEWDARSAPAPAGAVRVKVKMPWLACRVGARYPALELGGGGKAYVLQDVTVASCGWAGDADDRPTEEVAFYYNKVIVRGWDPEKKEE